ACPHPCACYVPSEVHCTFRSLASVPAGISKHVERMNLGFNSIQALSQTSFAGLTKLELLMIHGNEIPDIPDGALRDLASLQAYCHWEGNDVGRLQQDHQKHFLQLTSSSQWRDCSTVYPHLKLHTNFIITIYITRGKIHKASSFPCSYHHGLQLFYFILFLQFLARVGFEPATSGIWGWHPTNLSHRHRPWVAIINNHSPGILKCKKDKAYEGGQLCAMCASPRKLFKQEIHKLKDVACLKPSIESPLRQNTSRGLEEEQEQEEDGDSQLVPEGFQFPRWNISLNMTDEHGNMVNLVCAIKKPTDLYKIHLNQTDPPDIEINATVALDFECPMTRENYEKLWKLIAYYSEVPVKLRRELMLSKDPKVSYQYRQDADDDALYYTGVKAQILAEPEWVAQPYIDLQLNRRQSTARKVLLSYYAQHSLTMSAKGSSPSWVMIEPSTAVQRAQTVLEGASCQLSCNVKASDSPSIFWILPDGSVLKAPMDDQDNKFSVLSSGWLRIKSMQQSDSGLYQCIAQVRDEMDQMVYRVLVQPPSTQPHERDTVIIEKNPGELVLLPCSALAIPEAHLSWILPNKRIIHDSANTSHAYMLPNGALSIPTVQVSDSGYYRCVAINQQGADHFTVGVTVSAKGLSRVREDVVEDEGASGMGDEDTTSRKALHPKDQEMFLKTKDEGTVGDKKVKKGRRKLKLWKNSEKEPETNVAEGRRVFESRRRINMANKQINPERWADILARVRGKNLPKGTEEPLVIRTTTPPSMSPEETPLSPAVSPLSSSPVQTANSVKESSAEVDIKWITDSTLITEPYESSPALDTVYREPTLDTVYKESTNEETTTGGWTTANVGSMVDPTSDDYEPPLSAISLAESRHTTDYKDTMGRRYTRGRPHKLQKFSEDTSTASMVTPRPNASLAMPTHSSQRKHNGRRRLRPHQSRHRHKQTPPTTSAPMETFSTQPTRVPEIKTPYQMVDSTVHLPKQMEIDRNTESVSKRTPRRKHKKRPHKQHYITSTMSSRESTSTPSPSPENKSKNVITPTLESRPWSRTVALKMGDSYEAPRVDNYMTTTTKIHPSHHDTQETLPTTYKPMLDKKEIRDDDVTDIKDTSVPGELVINVMSTSGSLVSSVGEVKEDSSTKDFSDTPSTGHPPRTGQAGKLQTDTPVTNFVDNLPDAPHLRELENEDVTAVPSSPSVKASTTFQQEALGHLTTLASLTVELPSGQTETTNQGLTQTTPSPALISSRRSPTSIFSEGNVFLNYVGNPETKAPSDSTQGTQAISSPNELSTTSSNQVTSKLSPKQDLGKELFGSRGNNSLPGIPDSLHQDGGVRISSQPSRVPSEPPPPRGTLRPPDMSTKSFFKYFATFQPSHHLTNRPLVTVSPSRALPENKLFTTPKLSTTTATPISLHVSKPTISSKLTEQRTDRFNAYSKAFGNNNLPEPRHPIGRLPNSRVPPYSNGRLPFYINRTFSFSQLGVTLKPQTSSSPIPVMRERIVNPSPYNRIHSQSTFHLDFGPPAPPLLHPPRTTTSPSANSHLIMLVSPTRSSVSFATSSVQSPGSSHQSIMKLFAGGPPASKFRTPGEKPQIITKFPQTVSITAETDAVFPCEATGKPTPFITWTKVSTGVLITPSTRVQRFEVLKNGTLVIRRVQVQDRGQYVCTASNLHGLDRLAVLLAVTVQQPQILASHYQDVTVYLGDTIAMECLAKGTPAPQISWVFPDRTVWHTVSRVEGRITLHENRTLSIKEASFSDRGVYKCVASNAAGADSLAIRLHVAALPPVIQQDKLENISLPPGLSIHIHCSAKAAPLPSVRWVLWDGTQIRPSQFLRGNLFVFPNGTLYIRNLAPKDSGRYECVAANLVGSARRTVLLTVHRTAANARITGTSPQRTDVRYGGTLRLDCSASGDPWPRILWRLPSKRMMDTLLSFDSRVKVFANGTLVVKSVTEKDAGDYLCVARNKVGDDYVVLKVNVVMKPAKIEHKENDHKVFYGGDLKVDCVATGLPNPEISWSLPDGSLVNSFMQSDDSGARTKRYVVFNNGTLYFNEVGMREEGDYTCFAENQVGKDEMRVRVKVVAEPAAILNKTYLVVRVPYGEVVTIPCDAKGEPLPKVTWLSPTNRLMPTSSEKYQIYQDGTLLIQKAQRSDSGNYTCVVRNSAGEDRKTVWIHVTVQPPKINGKADALTTVREIAAVGSRKLVPCQAEGVPAPRVLWAFPEGVILPAPYFGNRVTVHRNGTLDIKTLRKTDSVQLVCIARNEGGEARMVVQLTVLEPMHKPVFHDPVSEKITATAGHTISLNCSAAGTPLPSLSWVLPNGTELLSGRQLQRFYHKEDGMLHISDLSSVDAGAYRCVARNAAGHAERLVSLKVGLKPEVSNPHHNLVSIINGDTLHLQCVPPGDSRRGRFSWTLPNGVVLESPHVLGRFSAWDNGTLTVREASVFDRGTYTCRVETEHGPTVTSIPVIVIAYPPRITSEPTPVVYARPGNTVKLNCMAVGIPKAEITWELPDKSHLTAGAHARLYGNRFLQPQGALTIQLATQRDAGFYKCTAKNVLGSDSKTTYIHVL
uniref:Matrix remodeling associated 5 n=1 Tax=Otolemur garnettii TaxID=30611 RepID=H0XYA2_OTOGA